MLHNGNDAESRIRLPDALMLARNLSQWTAAWHLSDPTELAEDDLLQQLHRANYTLWHLEDAARDPAATDSSIAEIKRSIDRINQRRNDLVERFDVMLLDEFHHAGLPDPLAPLHSETPGMIADRLSILALKMFHTAEEAARTNAGEAHLERNRHRLLVLQQQSHDLTTCLAELLTAVTQRRRGYRLYRQMKMYNDPELNPVMYSAAERREQSHPA